ncbi:MAG: phosphonopyruvate decarboxylase [Solobacterium sp.]|nr:phosphonopyruvate decarboxylase [Solobacterium sp.]
MKAETLMEILGADFYAGVPDSQLKALCSCLMHRYGIDARHHVIAANEGNCAALAAGYHLATGKVPAVYMQNSGEGNIINPLASLLNEHVYAIPMIFVIGWRGEPGVHDEPQHIFQGEITKTLMDVMGVSSFVISKDTPDEEVRAAMDSFQPLLKQGKDVAFIIRKGALTFDVPMTYENAHPMKREEIIAHIAAVSGNDPVISTTGKASRELFEIRTAAGETHARDFLTVGSMGHASSIALGVAANKPETTVWCIDGDGAALMHMGSLAVIGSLKPANLIHVVINNEAHETVGGMPTAAGSTDLCAVAKACGYEQTFCVKQEAELDSALHAAKNSHVLSFIEVKSAIGARENLGRPTTSALENKQHFMEYLKGCL